MIDEIETPTGKICPMCGENPATQDHICEFTGHRCECCAACIAYCEEEND